MDSVRCEVEAASAILQLRMSGSSGGGPSSHSPAPEPREASIQDNHRHLPSSIAGENSRYQQSIMVYANVRGCGDMSAHMNMKGGTGASGEHEAQSVLAEWQSCVLTCLTQPNMEFTEVHALLSRAVESSSSHFFARDTLIPLQLEEILESVQTVQEARCGLRSFVSSWSMPCYAQCFACHKHRLVRASGSLLGPEQFLCSNGDALFQQRTCRRVGVLHVYDTCCHGTLIPFSMDDDAALTGQSLHAAYIYGLHPWHSHTACAHAAQPSLPSHMQEVHLLHTATPTIIWMLLPMSPCCMHTVPVVKIRSPQ